MCEQETGTKNVAEAMSPTHGGDGLDDVIDRPVSTERDTAMTEYYLFHRLCKTSKYFPKKYKAGTE